MVMRPPLGPHSTRIVAWQPGSPPPPTPCLPRSLTALVLGLLPIPAVYWCCCSSWPTLPASTSGTVSERPQGLVRSFDAMHEAVCRQLSLAWQVCTSNAVEQAAIPIWSACLSRPTQESFCTTCLMGSGPCHLSSLSSAAPCHVTCWACCACYAPCRVEHKPGPRDRP